MGLLEVIYHVVLRLLISAKNENYSVALAYIYE